MGDLSLNTGVSGSMQTVASYTPNSLYTVFVNLASEILHLRTWGTRLNITQSEELDDKLRKLAIRVRELADKEAGFVPTSMRPLLPKLCIPPMTHPLSKGWSQPDVSDIHIDDAGTAHMSLETFRKLADYTHSTPSGVYEGKMWKAQPTMGKRWFLLWFEQSPNDPNKCRTVSIPILLLERRIYD